MLEKLSEFP